MLDEEPAVKRAKVDTSSRNLPDSPGMRPQPGTPSCGAPRYQPESGTFTTEGGVSIVRSVRSLSRAEFAAEKSALVLALDNRRGCIFESAYEYPGRYQHWTMGFVDPPIAIAGRGRAFDVTALNARGRVLIGVIDAALRSCAAVERMSTAEDGTKIVGNVRTPAVRFSEEERSKQPSIFSVVRAIRALFAVGPEVDPQLGLYGSFGYDLTFQFEPVKRNHARDATARDLLLYLPDSIVVSDGTRAQLAWKIDYDFVVTSPPPGSSTTTTITLPRVGASTPFRGVTDGLPRRRDHAPGLYAKKVEKAREQFRIGNLFETVLSQVFYEPCAAPPSEIFDRLRVRNPSPYMFIINLGEEEHLVGASPEMFVRCETTYSYAGGNMRVETCPISGTIRRGATALEDAERIKEILTNKKEESELTMCTDVDRNDKSRVCVPGSVRVVGRRQIEKYSRLIHTVDHVEGILREGFDALDAFLVHTWAVTVTGAPKPWAIQFVEDNEETPRRWYAGAVGLVGFDGHLNTGLTLRTIHIDKGVASVRAGATLLYDSDPAAEEAETELKASAFRDAILRPRDDGSAAAAAAADAAALAAGASGAISKPLAHRILLVDHEDSFVHTLANYLRQCDAAAVETVRAPGGVDVETLRAHAPTAVVLSPGPGKPSDFGLSRTIQSCIDMNVPIFGVCLGLQGIVEFFGGELAVLSYPMHGKPSPVVVTEPTSRLFAGLPSSFTVARYHSLHAVRGPVFPNVLTVTAETEDGVVMAVEHKTLPISAVQFHPESILTAPAHGLRILSNALGIMG